MSHSLPPPPKQGASGPGRTLPVVSNHRTFIVPLFRFHEETSLLSPKLVEITFCARPKPLIGSILGKASACAVRLAGRLGTNLSVASVLIRRMHLWWIRGQSAAPVGHRERRKDRPPRPLDGQCRPCSTANRLSASATPEQNPIRAERGESESPSVKGWAHMKLDPILHGKIRALSSRMDFRRGKLRPAVVVTYSFGLHHRTPAV